MLALDAEEEIININVINTGGGFEEAAARAQAVPPAEAAGDEDAEAEEVGCQSCFDDPYLPPFWF